jgi:hypothetical protein
LRSEDVEEEVDSIPGVEEATFVEEEADTTVADNDEGEEDAERVDLLPTRAAVRCGSKRGAETTGRRRRRQVAAAAVVATTHHPA